ncbi:hypothetical protein ACOSQ2_019730 [Xanthoceras sorbifolium]
MFCITSVHYKVIVNGEASCGFSPEAGIRQGDPLSPYIFVLCMEKLSHIITQKTREGEWRSIKLSRGGPEVSHLFFADDLILFGQASSRQAKVMKHCLDTFCRCSGQQVVCRPKKFGGLGIKKIKEMNQALLAKVGWRLGCDREGLWGNILRSKYLQNHCNDPNTSRQRGSCSSTWRAAHFSLTMLNSGLIWRVGCGNNIYFWKDIWVPEVGVLVDHALQDISDRIDVDRVKDYIMNGNWNKEKLATVLNAFCVEKIICICFDDNGRDSDKLIWGLTKNGSFSVSSAYASLFAGNA